LSTDFNEVSEEPKDIGR